MEYGWRHRADFDAWRAAGKHFLYVDLGYWGRRAFRGDYSGIHKVVLDARHATGYFRRGRPADRLAGAPVIKPWRESTSPGGHVVLAGLSAKGAHSCGLAPYEWERRTIAALRRVTARPILYRPKPSWAEARPIPGGERDGVGFSPASEPLEAALEGAHALVTCHSNAALDALCAGIPVCAEEGLASVMATPLEEIETPQRPAEGAREQLLADISYTHFARAEIVSGAMLRQFLEDGLIE